MARKATFPSPPPAPARLPLQSAERQQAELSEELLHLAAAAGLLGTLTGDGTVPGEGAGVAALAQLQAAGHPMPPAPRSSLDGGTSAGMGAEPGLYAGGFGGGGLPPQQEQHMPLSAFQPPNFTPYDTGAWLLCVCVWNGAAVLMTCTHAARSAGTMPAHTACLHCL